MFSHAFKINELITRETCLFYVTLCHNSLIELFDVFHHQHFYDY